MKNFIISYGATLIPLLLLDGAWLAFFAKSFYMRHLQHLIAPNFTIAAACLFYLLYALGITILLILPAQRYQFSTELLACQAALFGLVAYGTYDLTNQALLAGWPLIVTVVDMAWGVVLTALTAAISYTFIQKLS